MPLLPAALKGCDFLITLETSSSGIDKGEGISGGYAAIGMSERLALGMGGKNLDFNVSAFPDGVVAVPDGVTRLMMDGGAGGRWLLVFAHFASGHMLLLPLAESATACLKCNAFACWMADPLALSASK